MNIQKILIILAAGIIGKSDADILLPIICRAVDAIFPEPPVNESKILFYYTSRITTPVHLTVPTVSDISTTDFDPSRPTFILIHGWLESRTSPFYNRVQPALLEAADVNIFEVDWGEYASNRDYVSMQTYVLSIGHVVANFINGLVNVANLDVNTLTLTGHSLGAHVAGRAGADLNGTISSIVGLDAAKPCFNFKLKTTVLDLTDAKNVQAIHTGALVLGTMKSCGHSDFYPNHGLKQRGCGLDVLNICSHKRAYKYYAESLTLNDFTGYKCQSYVASVFQTCSFADQAKMGGVVLDPNANGIYYLSTNPSSPYGQG